MFPDSNRTINLLNNDGPSKIHVSWSTTSARAYNAILRKKFFEAKSEQETKFGSVNFPCQDVSSAK